MTASEVAAELGCHVETVYAMARASRLPGARRHGTRSWRFHREELEAYMRGRVGPVPDASSRDIETSLPAERDVDDVGTYGQPHSSPGVTASELERLGLLLLGHAKLLQRQELRPRTARR
jgi:excisionase family DNA binding protein